MTKLAPRGGTWFIRIQASIVTVESPRLFASGIVTVDPSLGPEVLVKLKPCPIIPGAKLTSLPTTPLLPLAMSSALASPGHQPTIPIGAGVQADANTLNPAVNVTDSGPEVIVRLRVPAFAFGAITR